MILRHVFVHVGNDDDKTRFYNFVRNKTFIGPLSKTIMFAEARPKGGDDDDYDDDDDDDDDDDGRSVSTIITLMKYKLMKELLLIKIFYKKLEYTKPITTIPGTDALLQQSPQSSPVQLPPPQSPQPPQPSQPQLPAYNVFEVESNRY